jgi:hypothetical protein
VLGHTVRYTQRDGTVYINAALKDSKQPVFFDLELEDGPTPRSSPAARPDLSSPPEAHRGRGKRSSESSEQRSERDERSPR